MNRALAAIAVGLSLYLAGAVASAAETDESGALANDLAEDHSI